MALLSRSLDQELGPLELRKLERHLRECPGCRRRGESIEAITHTLRSLPLATPSVPLQPRLPWRRRVARTGFPAAAAVAVASLGLVALQGSVNAGSGSISPAVTVSSAPRLSPVTHSLPPQPEQQSMSAAVVWLP